MTRLKALSLLEERKITLDEAKRELAKPERPPGVRPVWRLLVKVKSSERNLTIWLPWAPLALIAAAGLPIGWGMMKRRMNEENMPIGLGQALALLAQLSATGGGLFVEVRNANGEYVKVAM